MKASEVATRGIGWLLGLLLVPVASVVVRFVHGAPDYEWED